ncbi:stress-related protein-like [Nicotiana tabacum]|uniref:Stress-related protein-like n=2 Tax=Nicotiana TaxID=4085 RepID=A0A1S4AI52_TOBAC|nr:PREDICTED: stress-related protein [Nicotiana sylvestris]XP_016476367.1 PREDICTED: stress-related protein-like [Nicotiana tabacum]
MAEAAAKPPTDAVAEDERKLKYLDFVQVTAIYVIVCFSTLYEYAKGNSGPLKPGVEAVEATVKTVIGPVYEKFHDVPFDLLKFVYFKVEDLMIEVDRHVPYLLKQTSYQALLLAQKVPELARDLASEIQRDGLVDTANSVAKALYKKYEPTGKELYEKYEPLAEKNAVSAWRSLNRLPLFPQVAQILVPTAAYWSEKYNQAVAYASERGYAAAYYFPIIPLERIAKVFEGGAGAAENGHSVSVNDGSVTLAQ